MKLSKQDADLFFKLMWSLQNYVNLKMGILPDVETVDEYQKLPSSEKLTVRDALYDNIEIVDTYLEENPQDLSKEEMEIIKSWKKFQRGDFFIERVLKKYAIFIGGEKVYAVLALYDPIEDVFPYGSIPYYAKAVLLPFKGYIIYDGLLQGYSVMFGGGIKFDLKETYMAAKQNCEIIESFDPKKQAEKSTRIQKPIQDWAPAINEISKQAKKLRSSSGAPAIHGPAFSLAKASIDFARLAVDKPGDTDELWKALEKVERARGKIETVLYRAY
ncbi:MAG: hypothetical protein QGM50_11045 [Anaerolineae bacterium]|nr:hypothetical protein [Anaerolineae bacterium]